MDFPKTRTEAEVFVRASETRFRKALEQAAEWSVSDSARRILTISGPTCSGKTTAAAHLRREMERKGRAVIPFSFDDFFKDRPRDNAVTDTPPDYDTVQALDLDCLGEVLEALRKNCPARIPIYDFVSGTRTGFRIHTPVSDELHLWEGIQAVYPEVLALLGKPAPDIVLTVEPPAGWGMTGDSVRLCRRILRDVRCRGASPDFTLFLWQSVRENEKRNIEPYLTGAGIRINSCMDYEPYVLSRCLLPLLRKLPDSPNAEVLAEKLAAFPESAVTPAMVPQDSVFREFIGTA